MVCQDAIEDYEKFSSLKTNPLDMEISPANLELAKLFIQPIGLNAKIPLVTTKKIDLSSGYNGSTELTGREDEQV